MLLGRLCSLRILKKSITSVRVKLTPEERSATFTGCHRNFKNSTDYSSSLPQESSLFRSLLGVTVIIGGASVAIYFNKSSRDFLSEQVPQLKTYFKQVDEFVEEWKPTNFQYFRNYLTSSPLEKKRDILPSEHSKKESSLLPEFPSVADVGKQVSDVPEMFKSTNVDLQSCINNSENAVLLAINDLKNLREVIKNHLDNYQSSSVMEPLPICPPKKLKPAHIKAVTSHQSAQQHLTELRSLLDSLKPSVSQEDTERVQAAIKRYGELGYELSGLVNEVRGMQTHLAISLDFTEATNADHSRLNQEIKSILPSSISKNTPLTNGDGSEMTKDELNLLLSIALERIEKLCSSLVDTSLQAQHHLLSCLETHRNVTDKLINEAIERELSLERNKHEIERFKWDQESKDKLEYELNLALARHGHHLSQMLRLKQDEMEHQFDYQLREALVEQKIALEGELQDRMRKLAAIDRAFIGRADSDRISKFTQALSLTVEALASAIELPCGRMSTSEDSSQNEENTFHKSEPLSGLVNAVKSAALGAHFDDFALDVVDSLPAEIFDEGVYTRRGLLHRFNKVYNVCRNVAIVDETGTSLWGYFLSWLQAKLNFDRYNHSGLISHIPGLRSGLLTPDTEIPENTTLKTFCLLASAKAALMPDPNTSVSIDALNCSDIEFAVRILSQLEGQPAVVASDWLRDARLFLEVHQLVQALLAYTTVLNISSFDKRL